MIVFLHVERTGGSKLLRTIGPHFPGRCILVLSPVDVPGSLERARSHPNPRWFVGGHLRFTDLTPFLAARQPSDILFSTTRNPLERAISLYFFTLRHPSAQPELARFAEQSFAAFYAAAVGEQVLLPNAQCRFLADSTDWREARRTIRRHYNLVGVHLRYGRFLERLRDLLRSDIPGLEFDSARHNAAYHQEADPGNWKRKVEIDTLVSAPLRRRIERDHEGDFALVEFIASQPDGVMCGPGTPSHGR